MSDNITNSAAEHDPVIDGKAPAPKRKGRRAAIAGVVVAAVLVVAGAGLWVWHEQPSFCGAICHTPMDNYLATYEAPLGQATTDKWGNPVADSSSMLAAVHAAEGDTCMDCHIPTLSEQVSEGVAWVAGNYEFPLLERDATDLTEASGRANDELCLNESCHNLTREDLVEKTADMGTYNPHEPHHMELDCTTCHKAHRASVMYCSQCHAQAEVPEGWISMGESNELVGVKAAE
ncbi:cytochrome c3 family protein [Parvibacter caecicola]|uniref:cytochrome c-type protein Cgr1 n=1 Tax=Parvibacter caecicola TaxID=747645 RepID=UPI00249CBD24|nr:cytochrome c3 family protein [Parvibacter caecicola]